MGFDSISLTDGYNVSSLVNDFHNITRYGLDFHRSDATILDHNLENYGYQLATFGIMSGIVFAILTFILFTLCFCACFFKSSAKTPVNKYQRNNNNRCCQFSSIIIILLTILTMTTYIIGFIGQRQFGDYTLETCNTIKSFVVKIEDSNNKTGK